MTVVAQLNDQFRRTFEGGPIFITRGVTELPQDMRARIFSIVRDYDNFSEENDPHGEHDFGSFMLDGVKLLWKIDYYNLSLSGGSKNPGDPKMTTRVLTIMRAEEY